MGDAGTRVLQNVTAAEQPIGVRSLPPVTSSSFRIAWTRSWIVCYTVRRVDPSSLSPTGITPDPWERREQMLPTLSPTQIKRIASYGVIRRTTAGQVLLDYGQQTTSLFVVLSGQVEVVRPLDGQDEVVAVLQPGQFTGELDMLSGRRSLVRARVREPGEVLEVDRDHLRSLVQTDVELSDVLMRAFIVRRMGLIARGQGDVIVIGSGNSAGTHRIREFLTRNGHPYSYIDLETQPGVQDLLNRFHVRVDEVPVVICRGEVILRNPTNREVADTIGLSEIPNPERLWDLVIVGAGPAGLSAAVYAASEGLDTLVLEGNVIGGQAGSSSRIENYLGFPTGISGQDLAGRAYVQAQKFGAEVVIARGATSLLCDRKPYEIGVDGGPRLRSRALVISTGAVYRKLPLPNIQKFEGVGVYYSATFIEAQLCEGQEVVVVGGGNSAGQAAVYLSSRVRGVQMLVRSGQLSDTMSQYLIRRIEMSPVIKVRYHTEIVELKGSERLEKIRCRNTQTGAEDEIPTRHVFVMTGAIPNSQWLQHCVVTDEKGFIRTGSDLTDDELSSAGWPLTRKPYLFETTLPGVFAIGDVRYSSVKRVASSVGEGSIALHLVHRVLQE